MIRIVLSVGLMVCGLFVLGIATLGMFRFDDVLNKIHVAAKCDTMGAMLFLLGLAVWGGLGFAALKLALVILFLWLSNPVASHLVAKTEFHTAADLGERCEIIDLTEVCPWR